MRISIQVESQDDQLSSVFEARSGRILSIYMQIQSMLAEAMEDESTEQNSLTPKNHKDRSKDRLNDRETEAADYHVGYDELLEYVKSKPMYEHCSLDIMMHFFGRPLHSREPGPEAKAFRRLREHLSKIRHRIEREEGGKFKGFFKGPIGSSEHYKVFRFRRKVEGTEKDGQQGG